MISGTIWIPCLVISVCSSAAFVAILLEHRKDGSYLLDALLTKYLPNKREPSPGEKRLMYMYVLPRWFMQAPRKSQEQLLTLTTSGLSIMAAMLAYTLVITYWFYADDAAVGAPLFATFPLFAIFGYLMGRRVVAPKVVAHCSDWLNPE